MHWPIKLEGPLAVGGKSQFVSGVIVVSHLYGNCQANPSQGSYARPPAPRYCPTLPYAADRKQKQDRNEVCVSDGHKEKTDQTKSPPRSGLPLCSAPQPQPDQQR